MAAGVAIGFVCGTAFGALIISVILLDKQR